MNRTNSFSEKITSGQVYVDKTQVAWELIRQNKLALIEAPKGTGKTLLLDSIEAMFAQEYHLFMGLKTTLELTYLPFVRVVRIDGADWDFKHGEYLQQLQMALSTSKVVLLLDNLHLVKGADNKGLKSDSFLKLLTMVMKNEANFRLAILVAEAGYLNVNDKQIVHAFQNISQKEYVRQAFHFSEQEVFHYFHEEMDEISEVLDLDRQDLFQYLLQYCGSSCCNGLSPRGVFQFIRS